LKSTLAAMIRAICISILCALFATEAHSDEVKNKLLVYQVLPAATDQQSKQPPSCLQISNECQVCELNEKNEIVCSSVGIACEPTEFRCLNIKDVQ